MLLKNAITKFCLHLVSKERSMATISGYENVLNAFLEYQNKKKDGDVLIERLTLEDLEEYLEYHRLKGNQAKTRNRIIYIFKSFFSYLYKRGEVKKDITLLLETAQINEKERTYLQQEEVITLIKSLEHEPVKTAVITLANTGLRISELSNLTLDDVNFNDGLIYVRQGKGNKDRMIPMNKNLQQVLNNYLNMIRPTVASDYFFATARTGRLSRQTVNEHLIKTVRQLGWKKHVTAHILRHSFASALVENNVSLAAIQTLLGHSDLKITSRYIHQNVAQLQEAVNTISGWDNKKATVIERQTSNQELPERLDAYFPLINVGLEAAQHLIVLLQTFLRLLLPALSEASDKKIIIQSEELMLMIEDFSLINCISQEEIIKMAVIEFLTRHNKE